MPIRQHRPRRRNCDECKQPFMTERAGQKVCCPIPCGRDYAIKQREKKEKRQSAIDRKAKAEQKKQWAAEKREYREKNMSLPKRAKKAQDTAFNPWVRERDFLDGCISCGRTKEEVEATDGWISGGVWDAGHYLSVGSHPELRFEPDNCHKQCKSCNGGSGKYARKGRTVASEYRIRLIEKIGLERVEWLEGPHEPKHYTIPELQELTKHYRAEARRLKKERESIQ